VPFDNTAKLIAIGSAAPGLLPGIDATDFFERYLEHGVGGTCWPSSNALFELLYALGFDARRAAGSMRDTGIVSHGTVKVRIAGNDWLADSSILSNVPLPLTSEPFVADDPVFSAAVEIHDGHHVVWWDAPPNVDSIPCRMLEDDVPHDFYVERFEASRARSPFNERIYGRRNTGGAMLIVTGNRRLVNSINGLESDYLNESQLAESLRDEIGLSGAILKDLQRSPAWKESFNPPPPPPASTASTRKKPEYLKRERPSI
jgi:arylamine N-acetyltransferase